MKLIYEKKWLDEDYVDILKNSIDWLNVTDARYEYFMSEKEIEYTYGSGRGIRTYKSKPFNQLVRGIMLYLNKEFNSEYDICFLNRYDNEKMWLGWHSDDSPEIDNDHPIAVVSFGATREIWVKNKLYKGEIADCNKFELSNGSLFIMPDKFQIDNLHKIPKCDRKCGTRISLTFRKFKES